MTVAARTDGSVSEYGRDQRRVVAHQALDRVETYDIPEWRAHS